MLLKYKINALVDEQECKASKFLYNLNNPHPTA